MGTMTLWLSVFFGILGALAVVVAVCIGLGRLEQKYGPRWGMTGLLVVLAAFAATLVTVLERF
jgi:hypothetical protein